MSLQQPMENEEQMELYCDVLLRFLMVGSVMGKCDIHRVLGEALDSGVPEELAAALNRFENLPDELKDRIYAGTVQSNSFSLYEFDDEPPSEPLLPAKKIKSA